MTASPSLFRRFSSTVAVTSGRPIAFITALTLIVIWGVSGPFFGFSESWLMIGIFA